MFLFQDARKNDVLFIRFKFFLKYVKIRLSIVKRGVLVPKNERVFHQGIPTASRIPRVGLRKFF